MYEGTSFNIAKEYIGHRYKLGELKGFIKNNTYFNNNYENYDDDDYADVQVLENSYLGRSVLTTKDHRWYNSKELYYLNDSLGSVIGVERYNTVRPIRYNAIGEDINEYDGPGYFGYNGKQFDRITQTYNYGYRDYSPTQGRFTTVDPIKDRNNWMVYVNNDPVNYVDAFGLCRDESNLWDRANETVDSVLSNIKQNIDIVKSIKIDKNPMTESRKWDGDNKGVREFSAETKINLDLDNGNAFVSAEGALAEFKGDKELTSPDGKFGIRGEFHIKGITGKAYVGKENSEVGVGLSASLLEYNIKAQIEVFGHTAYVKGNATIGSIGL